MARNPARDQILFVSGEVGNGFGRRGGGSPGPGGKLVDEVVAGEDELLWSDLTGCAKGGGVGYWSPTVPEGREGGVEDVHDMAKSDRRLRYTE